jgi:hypothetical protein
MRWGAVLAAAALAVAACGNDDDSSNAAACMALADIAADWQDGIVQRSDLPGRWERVVRLSRDTEMHSHAQAAMAAARPPFDDQAHASAIRAMSGLC